MRPPALPCAGDAFDSWMLPASRARTHPSPKRPGSPPCRGASLFCAQHGGAPGGIARTHPTVSAAPPVADIGVPRVHALESPTPLTPAIAPRTWHVEAAPMGLITPVLGLKALLLRAEGMVDAGQLRCHAAVARKP